MYGEYISVGSEFPTFILNGVNGNNEMKSFSSCLLYTSDAADERSSVDLGGRRIIKKKHTQKKHCLLYTSPSPRDRQKSRMPSSA